MDFRPRFRRSLTIALLAVFFSLAFGTTAALTSTGTIDTNHYAWNDNVVT
jgi:ABC-type spermidine/putrescine transport system permease subunit II